MSELNAWDIVDANNNAAPPDGWPENTMQYSEVNNTGRAVQGTLKRYFADVNGSLQAAGVADAYTLTLNETGYSSYFQGMYFACEINATNTGASTIDVNGIGAQTIVDRAGTPLAAGEIQAGGIYEFRYDGTNFQVMGTLAGTATTSDLILTNSNDPDLADTDVALNIGAADPTSAQHLEQGPGDIQSKSDATTAAALDLNALGGNVNAGAQSGTGVVTLFNSGSATLVTQASGVIARGSVAAASPPTTEAVDTRLSFEDLNGVANLGLVGYETANDLSIRNNMRGGEIFMRGTTVAGIAQNMFFADPDTDVELFYNGGSVTRTIASASGGLEANNMLTGAGFERVLTTSDLGGANVIAGSADGEVLQWDTGNVQYEPSVRVFEIADGWQIRGTLNNDPAVSGTAQDPHLEFTNLSGQVVGFIDWPGVDDMIIRNSTRNGFLTLSATTNAGVTRNGFVFDPDQRTQILDGGTAAVSISTQVHSTDTWGVGGSVLDAAGVPRAIVPVAGDQSFAASFNVLSSDLYAGHVATAGTSTITLPASSVPFPRGCWFYVYNESGNNVTISDSPSGVNLHWLGNEGNAVTGNRTIADNGWARIWKRSATIWYIIGQSIS